MAEASYDLIPEIIMERIPPSQRPRSAIAENRKHRDPLLNLLPPCLHSEDKKAGNPGAFSSQSPVSPAIKSLVISCIWKPQMHAVLSSTRQKKWDKQAWKINLTLLLLQIADKCSSICHKHSHCEFIDLIILSHNWLRMSLASWLASVYCLMSSQQCSLHVWQQRKDQGFFWHFLRRWHRRYWLSWDSILLEFLNSRNRKLSASFHEYILLIFRMLHAFFPLQPFYCIYR